MMGYLAYVYWWPSGRGSIVVISEPPGAQIWVDLKPTDATTNGTVDHLSRGQHSVTVKLDTLQADPFVQVVHVHRGSSDTVYFQLRTPTGALARPVETKPIETAASSALSPESLLASLPTAAELRSEITDSHSDDASSTQEILDRTKAPLETVVERPQPDGGVIQVFSTEPGATIFVNDRPIADRTPASVSVAFGTYTIRVELEGYQVSPEEQAVRISRASSSPPVHFTLTQAGREVRAFTVETVPVEGRIFVDGTFVGEGLVTCERDYGNYSVTFGDVDGWRAPKPIRVSHTPSSASQTVTGQYTRLYHAIAEVNQDGSVKNEGINTWTTGIILDDHQPQPSDALGPKIKAIPNSGKYGWEMAMGDPNRNPTGGDYVLFSFDLPQDVPPDSPLNLRLYLYKSDRKYPFTLAAHSEMVVEVNGRRFLNGFTPRYETYAADLDRYEEWSLTRVLRAGENRILIYTGEGNTLFNHLWKIEIL